MAPPPSIHLQFLLALCISLPLIVLLVLGASYMENSLPQRSQQEVAPKPLPAITQIDIQLPQESDEPPPTELLPVIEPKPLPPLTESDTQLDQESDESPPTELPPAIEEQDPNAQGPSTSFFLDDDCPAFCETMVEALDRGSFSYARHLALHIQNAHPECESTLAKLYTLHADSFLLNTEDAIATITQMAIQENVRPTALIDSVHCWNPMNNDDDLLDLEDASQLVLDKWDLCCSLLESAKTPRDFNITQKECYQEKNHLCCGFFQGSLSHLRLPALQEVMLYLRFKSPNTERTDALFLEQDGFLRKFDPAGVLWPTGYLLAICLADPDQCGIPEVLEVALSNGKDVATIIELGAGIGAPSIVLSRLFQQRQIEATVLATDRALHALALIASNSQAAEVPVLVKHVEHHTNSTQLDELGVGYSIVLGSSLQSLFDWKTNDPQHTLWKVLDQLLDRTNPKAIAVLAHVVGAVSPSKEEGAMFELVRNISGNHLGMRTRSGDNSDFVISVYRRKAAVNDVTDTDQEL